MSSITRIVQAIALLAASTALAGDVYFATGFRVGEVSQDSAIIWARLTADSERNWDGVVPSPLMSPTRVFVKFPDIPASDWEGAVPGKAGEVRAGVATTPDRSGARWTDWVKVGQETDFSHQFRLTGLEPGTRYYVSLEGREDAASPVKNSPVGSFATAPAADSWEDVWFTVMTCQLYYQRDEPDGIRIYRSMANLTPIFLDLPPFLVATGDNVYYDRDNPRGTTVELCRLHWQRMYSLPILRNFFRNVPGYWQKDDHDTYFDDSDAELKAPWIEPLTWEQGVKLFHEQVPSGPRPFRSFRWGKGVEIWLTENREYRSPDEVPDGPEKTIWGPEQKAWLKQSILESDATFKFLISPTAMVGPDNPDQADSHANASFRTEGDDFRRWARDNGLTNLYVMAGDRHWQYASTDPLTGLREFACGPATDAAVLKGPGYDPNYHSFYRQGGGFISVSAKRGIKRVLANPQRIVVEDGAPVIAIRIHDVDGRVVYEYRDVGRMD